MSNALPLLGRRGFRGWDELLADLAAITAAAPPLNRVSVAGTGPKLSLRATGELTLQRAQDRELTVVVDGESLITMNRASVKGAWLAINADHFSLDVDIGPYTDLHIRSPYVFAGASGS